MTNAACSSTAVLKEQQGTGILKQSQFPRFGGYYLGQRFTRPLVFWTWAGAHPQDTSLSAESPKFLDSKKQQPYNTSFCPVEGYKKTVLRVIIDTDFFKA